MHFKVKTCCFMVLIITTCAELLALLTLVLYWRGMRENLVSPRQQQLCFRTDNFNTAKKDKGCPVGMMVKIENREDLCCGKADVILKIMVTRSVSEKYDSNANPEISTLDLTGFNCEAVKSNQLTLQLSGVAHDTRTVPIGTSSKIFWNAPVVLYVKSALKYLVNDGTIHVERTGYYYVASQVKVVFRNSSSTVDDTFRHYVDLISSKGVSYTLLESATSRCDTVQEKSEYTSFVGAVFELQKGDRMYVAISHPQYLSKDQSRSYFSIYSISYLLMDEIMQIK